jgi:maleylacetoacetate isomerase
MARQLYTFFRSSTSYRLRIALAYKGLSYEPRYVSLPRMEHRDPAYRALNPQGLVPLLVDEGKALSQSMAIIEYLDEKHPEPPLVPADIDARAYVRAASQIVGCDLHPLNNVRVLKYLKSQLGADEGAVNAWYRHWIEEGLSSLEAYVVHERRAGAFLSGNEVTMADICLVPQIFNARRFSCPLDGYPALMRVFESCMQVAAFRDTQPNSQADAVA